MIARTPIRLLLAAMLCADIAAPRSAFAAAPPVIDTRTPVVFAPEVEARVSEVLERSREAKRTRWAERMGRELDEVTRITGIDDATRKALQPLVNDLIASSSREWFPKFRDWLRNYISPYADQLETVEQFLSQTEIFANMDWFGGYFRPFEDPRWLEGLKRAMTPEQSAALEKALAEKKQAVEKETGEILQRSIEQTRAQQEAPLLTTCDAIKAALTLNEDRAAELRTLAKRAVAAPLDRVRARAARNLLGMEESQRQQVVASGQLQVPFEEADHEMQRAAWEAGLATLLSPTEQSRLRATQDEFRELRLRSMSRVLLTQLDEVVAFTAGQRGPLLPLLERALRAESSLLPQQNVPGFFRLSLPKLMASARRVEAKDLAAILDATQLARWQEACSGKELASQAFGTGVRLLAAPPSAAPADPPPNLDDAEQLEQTISDHLYELALKEHRRLLAVHLLKVEDVARTAGLPAEASAILTTAARGTAEAELTAWKITVEQNVRLQFRDIPPDSIRQRLANLNRFPIVRGRVTNNPATELWNTTLQSTLTDAQRAAWQKELDARAAYRDGTIAVLLMTEFHRIAGLSKEQWKQLEPRIAAAMKEYGPDVTAMFSPFNTSNWYLQGYALFVLIGGVPEAELKTILTTAQWEHWSASTEFANIANYWENVQRMHQNRVRSKTE